MSCVERGRWNYRSHEFADSPDMMYREARPKKSRAVSRNMAMSGSWISDQGDVWQDIDNLSAKLGYNSPTAAMQDVFQSRASVEEYLHDVTVADGHIGAIFAINGSAASVELFDSTDTLRTYLPKVLRSYALDAIANLTIATVDAEEAEAAKPLDSILELDAKSFPAIGLEEDLRVDSDGITGGALARNGRVIHLAAFQTALPKPTVSPTDDTARPLVVRQGHVFIRGGQGRLALLDTGSPVSIGRGAEYKVADRSWNPSTGMKRIFLEHTWRMHPAIGRFISDAFYDGIRGSRIIFKPPAWQSLQRASAV